MSDAKICPTCAQLPTAQKAAAEYQGEALRLLGVVRDLRAGIPVAFDELESPIADRSRNIRDRLTPAQRDALDHARGDRYREITRTDEAWTAAWRAHYDEQVRYRLAHAVADDHEIPLTWALEVVDAEPPPPYDDDFPCEYCLDISCRGACRGDK